MLSVNQVAKMIRALNYAEPRSRVVVVRVDQVQYESIRCEIFANGYRVADQHCAGCRCLQDRGITILGVEVVVREWVDKRSAVQFVSQEWEP